MKSTERYEIRRLDTGVTVDVHDTITAAKRTVERWQGSLPRQGYRIVSVRTDTFESVEADYPPRKPRIEHVRIRTTVPVEFTVYVDPDRHPDDPIDERFEGVPQVKILWSDYDPDGFEGAPCWIDGHTDTPELIDAAVAVANSVDLPTPIVKD